MDGYARFAWAALVLTLFVILWGAFVRATGSGAGCGSHWPLCNGEVLPHSAAQATMIEFTHRVTSGLALLAVLGLWWGARKRFSRSEPVRRAAWWSLFFMVTEAMIGAGLVLLEYVADDTRVVRGFWVAGHLLNTFLLVAAQTACAAWASGASALELRNRGGLVLALAAALGGFLLLGVSGAVTALGDTLFPAATFAEAKAQTFSETAHLFVRLRIWHPTMALLVGLLVVGATLFAALSRPTVEVKRAAGFLAALYVLELLVGLWNMWWLAPVWLQLVHLLLADLIWINFILLALAVLAREAPEIDLAHPQPLESTP